METLSALYIQNGIKRNKIPKVCSILRYALALSVETVQYMVKKALELHFEVVSEYM